MSTVVSKHPLPPVLKQFALFIEHLKSIKTKNKKIANLMKNQKDDTSTNYTV